MNETILKFGYPDTLIAEYAHWLVLLRPAQPTLGSLVLAAKGDERAFGALPPAAFAELGEAVAQIEAALRATVAFERINYLMLMMVDPHVHFHVIPRYGGERRRGDLIVADAGWPKQPELGQARQLTPEELRDLTGWIRGAWPSAR